MNAVLMNKRARRTAHVLHSKPPLSPLQMEQDTDKAKLDEHGTLQNIVGALSSISNIMGTPKIAFFQNPESFAVLSTSDDGSIPAKADPFNDLKRAIEWKRRANPELQ